MTQKKIIKKTAPGATGTVKLQASTLTKRCTVSIRHNLGYVKEDHPNA